MRRLVLGLVFLCAVAVGAPRAQQGHFQRLDIAATARNWQAVGRLELAGRGFCTGKLVAPDLVVTAAHCLYARRGGAPIRGGSRSGPVCATGARWPRPAWRAPWRIPRMSYTNLH